MNIYKKNNFLRSKSHFLLDNSLTDDYNRLISLVNKCIKNKEMIKSFEWKPLLTTPFKLHHKRVEFISFISKSRIKIPAGHRDPYPQYSETLKSNPIQSLFIFAFYARTRTSPL